MKFVTIKECGMGELETSKEGERGGHIDSVYL